MKSALTHVYLLPLLFVGTCLGHGHALDARNLTSVDGTRIYAEALGSPSNPPLLWIHGDSFSGLVFDKQFADPRLADSYYMVRMDLRGMGRSAKPANESDVNSWTPDKQAGDVQTVIDGFGLHKPVLLGWSYGNFIISDYIAQYGADKLSGVVTIGCTIGSLDKTGQYITAPPQFIADIGDVNASSDKVDTALAQFVWFLAFNPFSVWDFAAMKGIALGTDNVARSFVLTRPIDWTPFTNANSTLPLLIIFGKNDALFSSEFVDAFVTSGNWSSNLLTTKIIDDAGHISFWEKPVEFTTTVKRWLIRIEL